MNSNENKRISVVVPCYNEEEVLPELFRRMKGAAESWGLDWEIICIDDGSSDNIWNLLLEQHKEDPRWSAISFSRDLAIRQKFLLSPLRLCTNCAPDRIKQGIAPSKMLSLQEANSM
jgi:glycosyltransferase involved in cell wall biosynthesis